MKRSNEGGFSLVEMLVATAVFVVIFVAVLTLYDRSNRVFKNSAEAAELQQNVRVAFDKLVADVRMAGFDFDRDGIPIGAQTVTWQPNASYRVGDVVIPSPANGNSYRCVSGGTSGSSQPVFPVVPPGVTFVDNTVTWQQQAGINRFQQPDEQIEFTGQSAITIRANFDYETERSACPPPAGQDGCNNGREPALESNQFPVVTTGNDEIVTYALVSDNGPNADSISMYLDLNSGGTPSRTAFPGGQPERLVTITGLNLQSNTPNAAPPYTLYRFSFANDGTVVRQPVAGNIRSLQFRYYEDTAGNTPLTTVPYGAVASQPAPFGNGGGGQYDPNLPNLVQAPADDAARNTRAKIRSIQVDLVGMNEQPDQAYRDSGDTVAPNYRKFSLSSLVVPRNLGVRGMRELEVNSPGQPVITAVCVGYCGIAEVRWEPPVPSLVVGSVERYDILYDTSATGSFSQSISVGGSATNGFVTGLDPSQTYYFEVRASNGYGAATSAVSPAVIPRNRTTPTAPTVLVASGGGGSAPAAVPNQINSTWQIPVPNVGAPSPGNQNQITCLPGNTNEVVNVLPSEIIGYELYRGTAASFQPPGQGTLVLSTAGTPSINYTTGVVSFSDTSAANCVDYYYRVRAVEYCRTNPAYNVAPAQGISDFYPPLAQNAVHGMAFVNPAPAPKAPTDLTLSSSGCPGGVCSVTLTWPRVVQDVNGTTIAVDKYAIKRVQTYPGPPAVPTTTTINVTGQAGGSGSIQYIDSVPQSGGTPPQNYTYDYSVTAFNCATEGGPSPTRRFPLCTFNAAPLTVSVQPAPMDGTGTQTNPWLVNSPQSINVTAGAVVSSIRALVYDGSGLFADLGQRNSTASASFAWPAGAVDGVVYRVDVIAQDNQSPGCTTQSTVYVTSSSSSCCLSPQTFTNPVVSFVSGHSFVDVTLTNLCSNNLQIQPNGFRIRWNPSVTPAGTNLTTITYPASSGTVTQTLAAPGDSTGTVNSTPPAGAVPVAPNTNTYQVRIGFNQAQTQASNPITSICVIYLRPGVDVSNQSCQIFPAGGNVCP